MLLKKCLNIYLNHLRRIDKSPTIIDSAFLRLVYQLQRTNKPHLNTFSVQNFLSSNSYPALKLSDEPNISSIHVLIPFTFKDIEILPFCIDGAVFATSHHPKVKITLISDRVYNLDNLQSRVKELNINLLTDDALLENTLVSQIKAKIPGRSGWLIQQIIKIDFASKCTEDLVLVIDADTVLLRKQPWCDSGGRQILFESEEFHSTYYDFLIRCGFKNLKLTSHITHHMIYKPSFVKEMMISLGVKNNNWDILFEKVSDDSKSFASIDYEAYAQFLLNHPSQYWVLSKWSNVSMKRTANLLKCEYHELQKRFTNFNSLSFHDWYE